MDQLKENDWKSPNQSIVVAILVRPLITAIGAVCIDYFKSDLNATVKKVDGELQKNILSAKTTFPISPDAETTFTEECNKYLREVELAMHEHENITVQVQVNSCLSNTLLTITIDDVPYEWLFN